MADVPEWLTVSSGGFTMPTSEVLTGRGFITGKSGSGKSNTASVIAEELLEHGLPMLIVDTDGEYYGLKGRYELLHVGADADCDAVVGVEHAEKLAELALVQNVPLIVDVSGYVEEDERRELVRRLVERLFELGRDVRKPFLVFVEEIHEFLPQTGGSDELSDTLITVAKRGRKRGIGICGMSQRPAAVDKDFITQCDWVVWHRLTWDNDKRVAAQMLGADLARDIDELDTGEALLMTDWDERINRIRFRRKRTFDAGATPGLDDLHDGSFSPVRTALIDELTDEGVDLNAIDLDSLAASRQVPTPEPADVDLEATAEAVTDARSDAAEVDEAGDASLEAAPASDGGVGDVFTIPSRPSYVPPEPEEDDFDPVWELGHLTVYLTVQLGRAMVWAVDAVFRLVAALFAVGGWVGSLLVDAGGWLRRHGRRDAERGFRRFRQRVVQPAVAELEDVAARRVSDRLLAGAIVALLVVAIVLLLVS